jgi:hypothetical protein
LEFGPSTAEGSRWEVKEREWTDKRKPTSKNLWDAFDHGYTMSTKLAGPGDAAYSDSGADDGYFLGIPNVTWIPSLTHSWSMHHDRQVAPMDVASAVFIERDVQTEVGQQRLPHLLLDGWIIDAADDPTSA